jgi:hypothetical protein
VGRRHRDDDRLRRHRSEADRRPDHRNRRIVVGIVFLSVLTAAIASHFVGNDATTDNQADAERDAAIALRLDEAVIEISQQIRKLDERLARIEQAVNEA